MINFQLFKYHHRLLKELCGIALDCASYFTKGTFLYK